MRQQQPGIACLATAAATDSITRGSVGLINSDTATTKTVYCPIQFSSPTLGPQSVDPGEVRVDYWSSVSNVNTYIQCTPNLVKGTTLSVVSLGTLYSCAFGGGCGAAAAFQGNNYLSFSDSTGSTTDIAGAYIACTLSRNQNSGTEYVALRAYSMRIVSP